MYSCECDGVSFNIRVSVDDTKQRKVISVSFRNNTNSRKQIKTVFFAEPVLSERKKFQVLLKYKKEENTIAVTNPLNNDFKGIMRVSANKKCDIFIFDKLKLFSGEWENDEPIPERYPTACIGKTFLLSEKCEGSVEFYLSFDSDKLFKEIKEDNIIRIKTPDKNLDALINTFLPVQIIRGRLQARTGFYQCSGAFGFRDQLQDALSLSILCPEYLKEQILLNASAQFPEGDVMHWFHIIGNKNKKGVRTRYSDDLLWLPFAVSEYVNTTGDTKILGENVPFLSGEVLSETETERYFEASPSEQCATVFEHCRRAVEKSLCFGFHGLPLIMGGDWNDGFNTVGRKGKGESVWLGEFLIIVLERFSVFCDEGDRKRYLEIADMLRKNIDENAYNGKWYIRAFYDDGSALGNGSGECKIDSLSQSFAVFCEMKDKSRVISALKSAEELLVDREHGIIKLFSDGFSNDMRAGYISSYPVGLRENAGQYTHAAVWLCSAFIKSHQSDLGYELLKMLNPLEKYEDELNGEKYMTEPYFLAGDVYSRKGSEGRGGWSIYTGSAGWYYKTVIEDIFGIKKRNDRLYIEPNIPSCLDGSVLSLVIDSVAIEIEYVKSDKNRIICDGRQVPFAELKNGDKKIIVKYCGK